MSSWIEVSAERLAANYRALTHAAGRDTEVLAVVKADAYGHGADQCALELAQAGALWFGVANVDEGARVRAALDAAGFGAAEILVMCGLLREDVAALSEHRLTPVIWTPEHAAWLAGSSDRAHVEVETGMGRQGAKRGEELAALLDAMASAGIALDGIMTHFCAAEVANGLLTRAQQRAFSEAVEQVRTCGLKLRWVHAGSSSSLDNPVDGAWLVELARTLGARAMVRCGIALYGYCLPISGAGAAKLQPQLQPVMTWKTRVIDVREVMAGETSGYNATFTAKSAMRVALLPVGYADGLRRELASTNERAGGWVIVRGRRANILGRISMNLTVVDVTGIEGAGAGDEVVLLGDGITADDHARLAATISYEILCGVRAPTRSA